MKQQPESSFQERLEKRIAQIKELTADIKHLNERSLAHFERFKRDELRNSPQASAPIPLDQ